MTYFWKGGANDYWDNSANWFYDEALTVASASFPNNIDDVAIIPPGGGTVNSINYLSAPRSILAFIDLSNGGATYLGATDYTLTVQTALFAGSDAYNGADIIGDCVVFSGVNSASFGEITGDCVFSGEGSYAFNGAITGDCLFSGANSRTDGTIITGNCLFSGAGSYNAGGVGGNAFFTGSGSYSAGYVSGSTLPLVPIAWLHASAPKLPLDVLSTGLF